MLFSSAFDFSSANKKGEALFRVVLSSVPKCVQCTGGLILITYFLWKISKQTNQPYSLEVLGTYKQHYFKIWGCRDTFIFATHFRYVNYTFSQIEVAGLINRQAFVPHQLEETCSCPSKYAVWSQAQRIVSKNLYLNPRTLNLTTCYETLSFTN